MHPQTQIYRNFAKVDYEVRQFLRIHLFIPLCQININGLIDKREPVVTRFSGTPNKRFPWVKALTIDFIKKLLPQYTQANLLTNSEKILITSYTNCDFFSALVREEVDCAMATYIWLENLSKTNPYKVYPDLDLEDFIVEDVMMLSKAELGPPSYF